MGAQESSPKKEACHDTPAARDMAQGARGGTAQNNVDTYFTYWMGVGNGANDVAQGAIW